MLFSSCWCDSYFLATSLQLCRRRSEELCSTTWAVATLVAGGVGRLKAVQSGVATAQTCEFCTFGSSLRRRLSSSMFVTFGIIAEKPQVKTSVKMVLTAFRHRFHCVPRSTDRRPIANRHTSASKISHQFAVRVAKPDSKRRCL